MEQEKYVVINDFDASFLQVDFANKKKPIITPYRITKGEILTSVSKSEVTERIVMVVDRILQTIVVSDNDLVLNLELVTGNEDECNGIIEVSPAFFVSRVNGMSGSDSYYRAGDDITVIIDGESYTGEFVRVDWAKYEEEDNELTILLDGEMKTFGISFVSDIL